MLRKLNVIASKTLTSDLSFLLTLRSLSFSVTTKIKHPFSIVRTHYTTLIVQGGVLIMLEKHNEHYTKVALSMLGVIKTVHLKLTLMNVMVLNILKILCFEYISR